MAETTINAVAVPAELRALDQWVCWRREEVRDKKGGAKLTKVPYNARTGNKASSTNHRTWSTFDVALAAMETGAFDGVGFVLTVGSGIIGGDLDHCFDAASGEVRPVQVGAGKSLDTLEILSAVATYAEITPSGAGLRFFARGTLPEGGRKRGDFEIYNSGRFLTITGRQFAGSPATINERTEEIAILHQQVFGAKAVARALPVVSPNGFIGHDGTDAELFERMFASKSGAKIRALMSGEINGYPSQSEAEQALCFHLAFWTGRDAERMDGLFRQSALLREKWDERHAGDGATYGQMTIGQACEKVAATYSPTPQATLRGGQVRAYIRGATVEDAECEHEDAEDAESPPESEDSDEAALNRGLYEVRNGRTLFKVTKSREADTGGEENTKLAYVSDMAAEIVEVRRSEDGAQRFIAQGRERNGHRFTVDFEAAKFSDARYVASELSNATTPACVFYAGMEKHFAPAIRTFTNWESAKKIRQFDRVGWTKDGAEFIIPGMEPADVSIALRDQMPYCVASRDTGAGLVALKNLFQAQRVEMMAVVIAFALSGPLAMHAGWRNERSGLFGTGRTGAFKSSVMQQVMCLYGPGFDRDDLILKWGPGATQNSLDKFFVQASDVPLLIDNYKPITGGGPREMISLIQKVMEGGEKQRLNRNSELRPTRPFHVWPMFTGEDLPDGDAATMARVLVVPFAWNLDDDNPALSNVQQHSAALCAVSGAWIEWLISDDGRAVAANIAGKFPARRAIWAKFLREKRKDMVNIFRVASNLAINELTFEAVRACPPLATLFDGFAAAHAAGLEEVAVGMARHTTQALESVRFLIGARSLLASGRYYLQSRLSPAPLEEHRRLDRLGWFDDEGVYINYPDAKQKVIALYREEGGLGGVSDNAIYKQFIQAKALANSEPDRATVRIYAASESNRPRVLHFKPEAFWGDEEEDGAES